MTGDTALSPLERVQNIFVAKICRFQCQSTHSSCDSNTPASYYYFPILSIVQLCDDVDADIKPNNSLDVNFASEEEVTLSSLDNSVNTYKSEFLQSRFPGEDVYVVVYGQIEEGHTEVLTQTKCSTYPRKETTM